MLNRTRRVVYSLMASLATSGCVGGPVPPRGGESGPSADGTMCGHLTWWIIETELLAPPESSSPEIVRFAREQEVKSLLGQIAVSAERFCIESGGLYPVSLDQLIAHGRRTSRLEACTLTDPIGPDPWGRHYRYEVVRDIPRISSAGPDRRFGTGDDLGLPSPGQPGAERIDARPLCDLQD